MGSFPIRQPKGQHRKPPPVFTSGGRERPSQIKFGRTGEDSIFDEPPTIRHSTPQVRTLDSTRAERYPIAARCPPKPPTEPPPPRTPPPRRAASSSPTRTTSSSSHRSPSARDTQTRCATKFPTPSWTPTSDRTPTARLHASP